jgi:hypothetical protein
MNEIWIKIELVNGEHYIGSIESLYDDDSDLDLMLLLEEQAYMGIKLENVHKCIEKDSKLEIKPLDTKESVFKSSMLIMNLDNIVTIKFLKDSSSLVKSLEKKKFKSKANIKKPENVLNFRLTKKELV